MNQVRSLLQKEKGNAWVLWLDSDIILQFESYLKIAEAMRWAEKKNKSWTANYRMANGTSVLMKQRTLYNAEHYTDEEVEQLKPYAEIAMTGFGFAYINMDLEYRFRADEAGEDVNFFLDNPDFNIYLAKDISIGHSKSVVFW